MGDEIGVAGVSVHPAEVLEGLGDAGERFRVVPDKVPREEHALNMVYLRVQEGQLADVVRGHVEEGLHQVLLLGLLVALPHANCHVGFVLVFGGRVKAQRDLVHQEVGGGVGAALGHLKQLVEVVDACEEVAEAEEHAAAKGRAADAGKVIAAVKLEQADPRADVDKQEGVDGVDEQQILLLLAVAEVGLRDLVLVEQQESQAERLEFLNFLQLRDGLQLRVVFEGASSGDVDFLEVFKFEEVDVLEQFFEGVGKGKKVDVVTRKDIRN